MFYLSFFSLSMLFQLLSKGSEFGMTMLCESVESSIRDTKNKNQVNNKEYT